MIDGRLALKLKTLDEYGRKWHIYSNDPSKAGLKNGLVMKLMDGARFNKLDCLRIEICGVPN